MSGTEVSMGSVRGVRKRVGVAVLAVVAGAFPALGRAEYRSEKELKLDPGGRFEIEAGAGSVSVTGSNESGAHIVITSNRDDLESLFAIRFEETPGLARVTARSLHAMNWYRNLRLHFEVRVPEETELRVKTGGGSV